MYLKNLSLRNFRCFEKLDVDFRPTTTVVVGANGAGKTAILEAVAISLGTLFTSFDGLVGLRVDKKDARSKAYRLGTAFDVQTQYPVEITASGEIDGKSLEWMRSLNSEFGSTTIKGAKTIIDVTKEWRQRMRDGDDKLTLPLVAYYGTGRLWDYHREKKSDAFKTNVRTNGYIDALDGTTNVKLMTNWFRKHTVQKYQERDRGEIDKSANELDAVYQAMESCYARITGGTDVKIQYNLDSNELDVYYTDAAGLRMRIPLNQLSDGYKSTISLIADVAYRMAVLNPQLLNSVTSETEGVVLIDEIDLHLHPAWQQRILGDLRAIFPKVQFIVSTHAPAVINTVKSENLIILDELTARRPEGEVYGKDVNAVVSGLMNADERPRNIKSLFDDFYKFIDDKEYERASKILETIENKIGNDDGELVTCRVQLKLLQIERTCRDYN